MNRKRYTRKVTRPAQHPPRTEASGMTIAELLMISAKAGVLPHEMRVDPVHGLMVSPAGARKIAAIAPDQERAREALKAVGADVGSILNVDDKDTAP